MYYLYLYVDKFENFDKMDKYLENLHNSLDKKKTIQSKSKII